MVHMAQKHQPHAVVRGARDGFLPVTGLADTAPVRAVGSPSGEQLGENEPQTHTAKAAIRAAVAQLPRSRDRMAMTTPIRIEMLPQRGLVLFMEITTFS